MEDVQNKETIGERIGYIRKTKRISQKDLAKQLKIKANALSNYERGKRRVPSELINPIAEKLDVPEWLITSGVPKNVDKKYNLNYFINASHDQLTDYYNMRTEQNHEEFLNKRDVMYKTLQTFVDYIFENNLYTAQYDLFKVTEIIKEKSNYEEIISRMVAFPDDPTLIHFDSFENYLSNANIDGVTFDLNHLK